MNNLQNQKNNIANLIINQKRKRRPEINNQSKLHSQAIPGQNQNDSGKNFKHPKYFIKSSIDEENERFNSTPADSSVQYQDSKEFYQQQDTNFIAEEFNFANVAEGQFVISLRGQEIIVDNFNEIKSFIEQLFKSPDGPENLRLDEIIVLERKAIKFGVYF